MQEIVDFIRKQFDTQEFIPLHAPVFFGNEKKYLIDTIDTTFVSSVGEYVNRFEREIAQLTGSKKGVAVVNGTAALQIGLKLVGVKPNEEVITQALTFVATANAIAYCGASPIFVDVDRDTMGLSPKSLQLFLERNAEVKNGICINKATGKKISACVPMHTFGFMCRIDEIVAICETWCIPVVEDAAESLGSTYKGKPAGSFGDVAAISFNGNKIITAGGGGALVTNNIELGEKAKYLTTTAKVPHKWEYVHDQLGYNYRMPNINAALLCAQLESFDAIKDNKKELFDSYTTFFESKDVTLKKTDSNSTWNYWLSCLEFENIEVRDAFLKLSNEQGVMTRPIWQLMYRLPMYSDCQKDEQTNAEYLEARIVNIPSSARIG
jgi:aminotransferase in exopolysaccharide biosynthesis